MANLIQRRTKKRFTDQGWSRELADIRQKLERLTLFEDLTPLDERVAACEQDFFLFCKTYLPHYFTTKTQADFHDELVALAKTEEVPGVGAEPRGWAKSTIISFAYVIYCIAYQKKRFIVLCMETLDKAEMQVWRVLLELQLNRRIINDFGELVSKDAAHGDFSTLLINDRRFSTRLLALGAGQSARGLINAQFRPDLFICDDMESQESARNPKRVQKLLDLVLSDYLGCMCADHWTFVVVGTIICRGSMLDCLMENEAFNRLKHRAIEMDENGVEHSTWEELHPTAKLILLRVTMGHTRFSAEKQNDPVEDEGEFKESWFKYWATLPKALNMRSLLLQCDPSYSKTGDNKAIGILARYQHTNTAPDFGTWCDSKGVPFPEGDYTIILEIINRKCSIDDMILLTYRLIDTWQPKDIRFDGTYGQKVIFEREFGRYEAMYGRIAIKFIDLSESKDSRITALESPIQRGLILFPKRTKDVIETIIQFTRRHASGVPDDGPDMIAAGDEFLKPRKRKAKLYT